MFRAGKPQRLLAETADERALLAHGRADGGQLLLADALYPVKGDALLLPESATPGSATQLAAVFAEAAQRHRAARLRRAAFRVL